MTRHIFICFIFIALLPVLSSAQKQTNYLETELPETWHQDSIFHPNYSIDIEWWNSFNDSTLDSLINASLVNNYSLSAAYSTLQKAKASYRQVQSGFYPSLSLYAQYINEKNSLNTYSETASSVNRDINYLSGTIDGQWEIDIFGSIRKNVKTLKKQYYATEANYRNTMLTLCAEVATAYFNLRSCQQQYLVAQQNIESEKNILDITTARYEAGLATQLDVSQAKSVYYSTLASLPEINAAITQYINNIAVLVGTYPSEITAQLSVIQDLPQAARIIGIGIPANTIRQRPDVQQAELTVEAYAAALGASRADYYPKFNINGSFGYLSHDTENFFDDESMMYTFNPTLSWTLFSGLEVRQAVNASKFQLQESINQYNEVVINAVQEVESVMSQYSNALKTIAADQQVIIQGQKTLELSVDLYKRGLGSFTDVLDAQRSLLSYQNSLVSAENAALIYLVELYQALGGGF